MMPDRDVKELATAGASWWAEHFGNRSVASKTGVVAVDASASLVSAVPPPTADQVTAFRAHLEDALVAALTGSSGRLSVRTDYNPDQILASALEAAGLESADGVLDLPWKTTMQFRDGQITVGRPGNPVRHI